MICWQIVLGTIFFSQPRQFTQYVHASIKSKRSKVNVRHLSVLLQSDSDSIWQSLRTGYTVCVCWSTNERRCLWKTCVRVTCVKSDSKHNARCSPNIFAHVVNHYAIKKLFNYDAMLQWLLYSCRTAGVDDIVLQVGKWAAFRVIMNLHIDAVTPGVDSNWSTRSNTAYAFAQPLHSIPTQSRPCLDIQSVLDTFAMSVCMYVHVAHGFSAGQYVLECMWQQMGLRPLSVCWVREAIHTPGCGHGISYGSYGYAMGVVWIRYGCRMDMLRVSYEYAMGVIWYATGVVWICYGCRMDTLWVSYGYAMGVELYGHSTGVVRMGLSYGCHVQAFARYARRARVLERNSRCKIWTWAKGVLAGVGS